MKKINFKGNEVTVLHLFSKTYEDTLIKNNAKYEKRIIDLGLEFGLGVSGFECCELIYINPNNQKKYCYSFMIGLFDDYESDAYILDKQLTDDEVKELEQIEFGNGR